VELLGERWRAIEVAARLVVLREEAEKCGGSVTAADVVGPRWFDIGLPSSASLIDALLVRCDLGRAGWGDVPVDPPPPPADSEEAAVAAEQRARHELGGAKRRASRRGSALRASAVADGGATGSEARAARGKKTSKTATTTTE
jgi:hypothetical protein